MLDKPIINTSSIERVALKDERLIYRACSIGFAKSIGCTSPDEVIGQTDFDLFSARTAREQMSFDSRVMFLAQNDIRTIDARMLVAESRPGLVVRTPVMGQERQVVGVDLRLLLRSPADHGDYPLPDSNYDALIDEAQHGVLVIASESILFASVSAAAVLGFADVQTLTASTQVSDILGHEDYARAIKVATASPEAHDAQRLTLTLRTLDDRKISFTARADYVEWGVSRALLLSLMEQTTLAESSPPTLRVLSSGSSLRHGAFAGTTRLTTGSSVAVSNTIAAMPANAVAQQQGSAVVQAVEHFSTAPTQSVVEPHLYNETRAEPSLSPDRQKTRLLRLRSSEQRYKHYASAAADFFWETDAKLAFKLVSMGMIHILGLSREQIIGCTHQELLQYPGNVNASDYWQVHLEQLQNRQAFRDFEFQWCVGDKNRVIRYSGLPVYSKDGSFVGYRGVGCDVTKTVRQAEAMAWHANHDALTGLVNRRSFENTVSDVLEQVDSSRESHALCFMDLDSFKVVNDTCGHQAGDELLKQLARLFNSLVRKSDVIARLGGDEFGVLLYKCDVAEALKLANQIRNEVENFHFLWQDSRFSVGVSVGLVVVDDRWTDMKSLFNAADSACYIAKNEGRNRVVVYREGEGNVSNRVVRTQWVQQISEALDADRLRLVRQKIVPLGNRPGGQRYEMLLRLEMPNGDLVSPSAFLPSAERHGLSATLDERAVQLTLNWLSSAPERRSGIRHVCLNLSAHSCTDVAWAANLEACIRSSGVAPGTLCFEITETAAVANLSAISTFMEKIAELGCRFGIDDFGSGLSSFNYLRKLPVDFLKIDGQLVKGILDDPTDFTMVKAICDISRSMGKHTVAEYVETEALCEAVQDIGVDYAQGYYFGEPEMLDVRIKKEGS